MKDESAKALVKSVVDEFRRLRKEQGLSHDALAARAGLTRPAISFIESYTNTPTLLTCAKIAKALDVRLSDILAKYED